MTVPITSDLGGYIGFWLPVVLGCAVWGLAVLWLLWKIFVRLGALIR